MAQWLICPYWVSERRFRRDDIDRLYQIDYQITEVRVTNPSDTEGTLELLFYEQRGDRNFYPSDWAGGAWAAPPRYQRFYRVDPSRVFGTSFFVYGWFEVFMSRNEMVIDVEISAISKSLVSGGVTLGAGGAVESISQRTPRLVRKSIPLMNRIPELVGRDPRSPLVFPPGTGRILDDTPVEEPFRPGRIGP